MRRAESPSIPNALGGHEARVRSLERRPPLRTYSMKQPISLPALYNFGDVVSTGPPFVSQGVVVDPLSYTNHYLFCDGLHSHITFMVQLGPRYSVHEMIYTPLFGPDMGVVTMKMGRLTDYLGPTDFDDYANPEELIQSFYRDEPDWLTITAFDGYNATLQRNRVQGMFFRIMGGIDDPLTNHDDDADGISAIDGGPGIYAVRMQVTGKWSGSPSTVYRQAYSEIIWHRIQVDGWV